MTDLTTDTVRAKVRELMPALRTDLENLVRIQSVSADPARTGEVWRSADAVADLFRAEGLQDVDIVSANGGGPAVLGTKPGPEGAPVVLLYAHHDVQPENDHADWDSPPFEPTERRLRAATGSTAGARPTTRPASPRTWARSASGATTSRSRSRSSSRARRRSAPTPSRRCSPSTATSSRPTSS